MICQPGKRLGSDCRHSPYSAGMAAACSRSSASALVAIPQGVSGPHGRVRVRSLSLTCDSHGRGSGMNHGHYVSLIKIHEQVKNKSRNMMCCMRALYLYLYLYVSMYVCIHYINNNEKKNKHGFLLSSCSSTPSRASKKLKSKPSTLNPHS